MQTNTSRPSLISKNMDDLTRDLGEIMARPAVFWETP